MPIVNASYPLAFTGLHPKFCRFLTRLPKKKPPPAAAGCILSRGQIPCRTVKPFKAIAAMSLNRVIGSNNRIPWHLPEDFKWFKKMTTGQVIVMGRKTFESIGGPLPNRTTIVLSRSGASIPGIQVIADLNQLRVPKPELERKQVFICGGAQVYKQGLPFCSDLYLSLVNRVVEGDTFFPPFEDRFELVQELANYADFKILHYRSQSTSQ